FEVVAEAGDGRAAVAEALREQPDLVLLDCRMPGPDAFDVLPGLRAAAPDARVVLVSGHDAADLRAASRSAGAVGYLTKETPARRGGVRPAPGGGKTVWFEVNRGGPSS